jgi:DNA-binding winged helix-turn-helix (wHTH) protein/tetratricopeptide (TPR) repeat protein
MRGVALSANPTKSGDELYEFGPFCIDAQREILLRAGEPVPLTPKTFQILLVLVRHSQEVVTKDDLMKAVWPDTFVEDANLSRNIFMLRKALGESPQDHRYIVTVPGRGYRLAESVRLVSNQEVSVVATHHSKVQVEIGKSMPWGRIATALAGLLILAGVVVLRFPFQRSRTLGDKDTLVLADFANFTGDPVFDETLRQGLAVELEQSPFLSLISDQRVRQTLALMRQAPEARLTPQVAHEVCERTGSAAVLDGSIASLGTQYVLGLRAKNCSTGDILDEEQIQATRKEEVLNALSRIATRFRARIGESLATIEKHSTPLEQATTPSLEALKAYTTGLKANRESGFTSAVPHLRRAIAMDPQFAIAYGFLGLMYSNMGEADLAAEVTRKAYALRDRVSDRERLYILFLYDRQVTGNLKRAQQTLELWAQTYPRDFQPFSFLAGRATEGSGEYEKGIEAAQKGLELNPDDLFGYASLAFHNLHLGRLSEVRKTLQRANSRKLENVDSLLLRYYLAFLQYDQAGMEREISLARGKPGTEDLLSNSGALVLAYSGHLHEAEAMWQRAMSLAQETGDRERAGMYGVAAAACEAHFGDAAAATRHALDAIELGKGRDVEYGAAFALELSGDSFRAQTLAEDLAKRFPEDTSVQFSYLPTLHALFALDQHDASRALGELRPALAYDLAFPGTALFAKFGTLYTAYVRGEAYLASGRGSEAAAEFRKILDHRSLVLADPVGAVARLQLGRAIALSGDKTRAKAAYLDFLKLWQDADSDSLILQQARAEYSRLQ